MSDPEAALRRGGWVKVIAGASNQDLPAIADLCAIYAAAGADCLDVAADPAVVAAAREGIAWARRRTGAVPWLMVSLSDGEDPHFRKARFDPERCPQTCPRPCQRICPAGAIAAAGGIDAGRCYGCGRCLPACPLGLIDAHPVQVSDALVPALLRRLAPDAVEIHTAPGRGRAFARRLGQIAASAVPLRAVSVSCGPRGERQITAHQLARELWDRHGLMRARGMRPLWQLDGRPMSGDVGAGMAHAAVRLWQELRPLAPPGPLQLAGGTGPHTRRLVDRCAADAPAGVAFGGAARALLQPLWLEAEARGLPLREHPVLRDLALERARSLLLPWKLPRRGGVSTVARESIARNP